MFAIIILKRNEGRGDGAASERLGVFPPTQLFNRSDATDLGNNSRLFSSKIKYIYYFEQARNYFLATTNFFTGQVKINF